MRADVRILVAFAASLTACAQATVDNGGPGGGASGGGSAGSGGSTRGPGYDAGYFPDALAGDPGPGDDDPADKLPPPEWNCGKSCYKQPALGNGDPSASFAQPGDAAAFGKPTLVYPLADSQHPINLGQITFHWRRGAASQTLFRIRVAGKETGDFYVGCEPPTVDPPPPPDECVFTMPEGAWRELAANDRGSEVELTIAAADPGGNGKATVSAPVKITFSSGAVEGGLYYWSTALQGTYRVLFGGKKAVPFITPNSATNRFDCGGCHAVSRDGSTIAFAAEQAGYLTVAKTEQPDQPTIKPADPPVSNGHVMTLSPDGSRVLVSTGANGVNGKIVVYDTANGNQVGVLDPAVLGTPETRVYFPEFSPNGKEIVATLASQDERPWSVNNGYIVVFPYNDAKFGPAKVVVPKDAAMFHFYPSWSPDGRWIVFASAPIQVKSYDNPNARLRLVAKDGGKVYDLMRATQAIGKTSTWPKFAPFVQAGGNVMFVTFNSKIDYGLLLKNSQSADMAIPQLWMAAIDLRKMNDGDPSFAPIWIPYQDTSQRNHLGFWTERVTCRSVGGEGRGCGEGETCYKGQCYAPVQ
jgi:hypothetical protein